MKDKIPTSCSSHFLRQKMCPPCFYFKDSIEVDNKEAESSDVFVSCLQGATKQTTKTLFLKWHANNNTNITLKSFLKAAFMLHV